MTERSEGMPTERPTRARIIDLDVTRAIALIGVVVMNFHGYLINLGAPLGDSFVHRVFDPWEGPLSTRFAATFVTVAGMGVTLLTNRSRAMTGAQGRRARSDDRWTLIRRGVALYAFGYVFDWIWPGTILFYYGALFVIAALLFTLRTAWVATIGVTAAVAGTGIQWWVFDRSPEHSTSWLTAPGGRTPRGLLFDTFVNGTHPLLPWLAFMCLGIVLGRHLPFSADARLRMLGTGLVLIAVAYGLRTTLDDSAWQRLMFATGPFTRSLVYVGSTIGSTLAAIAVIGWIAEATSRAAITCALGAAGRMTLTLYVAHALLFNLLVSDVGAVRPTGLDTALLFAGVYWVLAILAAVWWTNMFGMGPLERIYRRFGGAPPEPWPVPFTTRP